MSNLQREKEIMNLLRTTTYASVDYLSKKLFASSSSIRRDLTVLEHRGLVKRTYGGVSLLSEMPGTAPFSLRVQENKREKIAVVRVASKLVKEGASLFIDSSTTVLNFSAFLTPKMNLTVFTNNMRLANLLASKHVTCYCIGGLVSNSNHVITTGSFSVDMIRNIYTDMVFFTSAALSANGDITDTNEEETAIRRTMLLHAREKVFLCPQNRFPLTATYKVSNIKDMNYVISDKRLPETFTNQFSNVTFFC